MMKGKPKKRYSQAARVHDIIRLIESRHGVTIEEVCEETGISRRTVHRDLIAIQDAGYPLVSEWQTGRKAYRFLTRFKNIPPITFSLNELATLYFLRGQADNLDSTPFADDLTSIFTKVRSVLPPRYAAHLDRISGVSLPLIQGKHDYRDFHDILARLRDALIHQYRITLQYLPVARTSAETYQVDPYTLALYKGGLYLIGYAHNRDDLRTFAVERIKAVAVERERFELPDDYCPEERLKDAFGIVAEPPAEITIRFSSVVKNSVSGRIWHPSQRVTELEDGSIEVSFTAGGRLEIISWILSYGEHAEVIEPRELRDEVASCLKKASRRYVRQRNRGRQEG
jgi:proteasome accessory factor B